MRNKVNVINTIPATTDYPFGRLKDDTGVNDGTPVVEANNGDIQETITGLMERAKMIPNELPDNVSNGYQIMDSIRENGGKFDIIHNSEIDLSNRFKVDFRLDNVYENEYLIAKFNSTTDVKNVSMVNKIIDTENNIYDVYLQPDFNSDFFNNGRYIIQKENNYFIVYPIPTTTILSSIYTRLEALEINNANAMRIQEKGTYIHTDFSGSGIAVIAHLPVNIEDTKIIMTCRRSNSSTSIIETSFSYILIDRSTTQIRVAFSNYPAATNLDPLRIDWWIVNN